MVDYTIRERPVDHTLNDLDKIAAKIQQAAGEGRSDGSSPDDVRDQAMAEALANQHAVQPGGAARSTRHGQHASEPAQDEPSGQEQSGGGRPQGAIGQAIENGMRDIANKVLGNDGASLGTPPVSQNTGRQQGQTMPRDGQMVTPNLSDLVRSAALEAGKSLQSMGAQRVTGAEAGVVRSGTERGAAQSQGQGAGERPGQKPSSRAL